MSGQPLKIPTALAEKFITSAEAARRLGRTDKWLRLRRTKGDGPAFVRYGKTPLYDPDAVDNWAIVRLAGR